MPTDGKNNHPPLNKSRQHSIISKSKHKPTSWSSSCTQSCLCRQQSTQCIIIWQLSSRFMKSPLEQEAQGDKNNLTWQKMRTLTPGVCTARDLLYFVAAETPADGQNADLQFSPLLSKLAEPLLCVLLVLILFGLSFYSLFILTFLPLLTAFIFAIPNNSSNQSLYFLFPMLKKLVWISPFFLFHPTQSSFFTPFQICLSLFPQPLWRDGFKTTLYYMTHVQLIQYGITRCLYHISITYIYLHLSSMQE